MINEQENVQQLTRRTTTATFDFLSKIQSWQETSGNNFSITYSKSAANLNDFARQE